MKKRFTGLLLGGLVAVGFGCTSPKHNSGSEPTQAQQQETPAVAQQAQQQQAQQQQGQQQQAPAAPTPSAASTLLAVGTEAPDFSAEAHDGTTVKLSALRGQPVVLYFYPKDETPG